MADFRLSFKMPPRKGKAKEEQPVVSLAPPIAEGEVRFGVAHIFASFNDTFVHVTDLSGKTPCFCGEYVRTRMNGV